MKSVRHAHDLQKFCWAIYRYPASNLVEWDQKQFWTAILCRRCCCNLILRSMQKRKKNIIFFSIITKIIPLQSILDQTTCQLQLYGYRFKGINVIGSLQFVV